MRRRPRTDDPVPREIRSFDRLDWGGTLEEAFAVWRRERFDFALSHRDLLTPVDALQGARAEQVRVGLRPALPDRRQRL